MCAYRAAVHVLGSRAKISGAVPNKTPHNIPFVALGTALLWFGWFGFNGITYHFPHAYSTLLCPLLLRLADGISARTGGSALASGAQSAYAAVNSEIAASTSLTVWMFMDWYKAKRPSLVGVCVGAIAGLATITPASGFVLPWAAFVIGIIAAFFCYACCELTRHMNWDDALDVWGVHGMGGALGSVLIGAFADPTVGGVAASGSLFGKQFAAVLLGAVYSYIATVLILLFCGLVFRLKPDIQVRGHGMGMGTWLPLTRSVELNLTPS